MNKKEKSYREMRKKRQKALLKRIIIDMGSVPIALYVVVSSFWIAISSILYIYSTNYSAFNMFFLHGLGADVVYAFVSFGILIFILTITLGIGCVFIYRANVLLFERGEKKTKSYIEEILEKKEEK